ncbi:HAMP domain-containing sensor histidine kinase [uncultured Tenacibaculum sp.]|uniref:sensor histidine kinase n=1 Tax=uncultured Tenacibaculum sp. TaxID=174713 RepID=UPI0026187767|nr:HAMP domain-containing sensor histidine kinase [uncultured Tenacibaculum sp.]
MSKKIILLVVASIIGLSALSLIQARLIQNTYALRKEAFIDKTSEIVGKIGSYATPIDSISDAISNTFLKDLDKFTVNLLSKETLLNRLKTINDSLNPRFISEYKKEIKDKSLNYNLKYHKILQSIILVDSLKTDTLYFDKEAKDLRLVGYDFENDPELRLGTSTWETSRSFERKLSGKTRKGKYDVVFKTVNYMNIDGWNRIILTEMRGLLIFSFCIFLFVIGLFYYSIKNLITQKKIADIKTDFINNITHELKTPLATLSLATKMLKKQDLNVQNNFVESTIETIERQNIRLQKLVDQVLNNSLGYNEIELQKESVSLNDFVLEIVDDFLISNKEISLTNLMCDYDVLIEVDKFYMSTVLSNILENAVKYGGTELEVQLKHNKGIEIIISDNGIGISKKDIQQIFNKFFRAENKDIHNVKGLGLGLYYSNQIIKAHNGTISVKSEKGKGTTFSIKLPLD